MKKAEEEELHQLFVEQLYSMIDDWALPGQTDLYKDFLQQLERIGVLAIGAESGTYYFTRQRDETDDLPTIDQY